jgi:putative tryptophan/tyrosine transport system substrate-binding protein
MKRREVIKLIGAWRHPPLLARAQQHDELRRIGVVVNEATNDPEAQASFAAFKQTLQQLGWSERRNLPRGS